MIVSRNEAMMWSKPPISILCALGMSGTNPAKELPENVTWISSGCIISEAMAAVEVCRQHPRPGSTSVARTDFRARTT